MLSPEIKSKLNSTIEDLENLNLRVEEGLVKLQELDDKFHNTINEVHGLFNISDDEWRIFDNWKQPYRWKFENKPGYAQTKDNIKIPSLIEVIKKILGRETQHIEKKEKSFSPDQSYEANRYILQLIQSAQKKLTIVDCYLDEKIFNFIDAINSNVEIWMLTGQEKKIFKTLFIPLTEQRKNIFAKFNNESHDRYILIDDIAAYHMGASISTIGKKDFMINKIGTEEEKNIVFKKFKKWWTEGKEIN